MMLNTMKLLPVLIALCLSHLRAEVVPSSMFGDQMVLQRGMPVPVWGKAQPGEEVTVRFAGHAVSATANKSGRWRVELPALKASAQPRDMTIEASTKVVFKDVLVGEVWVCSGQSNMQYGWGNVSNYPMYNWGGDAELAKLVPDAKNKPIRCFHVSVDASFSPKDNCRGKWSKAPSGSAVAFGYSYYLQKALGVPVGVIVTCWGSSSIEGWMPLDMTDQLPHFKAMMEQLLTLESVTRVNHAIMMGVRPGFVWLRQRPNLLYNAMLYPVIPYACRGMVWYQGEANAARPDEYAKSLPLWMKRLRQGWGRDDFNFLVVMLPGFGIDNGRPDAKSWAWFREAQMKALGLPHTGVVNTVDLGDAKKIHPADKAPVCQRLALLARSDVYKEDILGKGPMIRSVSVDGNQLVITFDFADGLKTTDAEPPKGFWLAGKDKVWHPAAAKIVKESIVLTADDVNEPVACRYAFCGKPVVNLVNKANLPAYPFRTDDWSK